MPTITEFIAKFKHNFRTADTNKNVRNIDVNQHDNRHENDEVDDDVDETEEIEDIDAPTAGTTIENPPNGGTRAWLIVLSCCIITALIGTIELMLWFSLVNAVDDTDIEDSEEALEIYQLYLSLASVFAILASVSMSTVGYEFTIHIGAWLMGLAFLILSFTKDIHGIKFLIYIMAGVGSGFVQLGVLVPVLEYFTTKRMRALMFTKISRYAGRLLSIIIFMVSDAASSWEKSYRICMGLCIVIGLVGLTVPSLKLKMKTDGRTTFVARTLGMGQTEVIKNALIWFVCILFFLYQIAVDPPNGEITNTEDMPGRLKLEASSDKGLAFIFSPVIGLVIGSILGWLFKKAAKQNFCGAVREVRSADEIFNYILILMVCLPALMAIMCFIAPEAANFPYFFLFSIIFSAQLAVIEELRDDSIPDVFGRQNVKFVEGLVQLCVGVGGIIGGESGSALSWKNAFRMGGGMMFVTTAWAMVLVLLRTQKGTETLHVHIARPRARSGRPRANQHAVGDHETHPETAGMAQPSVSNQQGHVSHYVLQSGQMQNQMPVQIQGQTPVNMQEERPVQASGQMPIQMQGQMPIQTYGQTSIQASGQMHIQASGDLPYQISGQIPIQTSGQMPVQASGHIPFQISGQMPIQTSGQMFIQGSGQMPIQASVQRSVQTSGQMHIQAQGEVPIQTSGQIPVQTSGQMPIQASGQMSIQAPGQMPTQASGQMLIQRRGRKSVQKQRQGSIQMQSEMLIQTPVNNMRLQQMVAYGPSHFKFVLPDKYRTEDSTETSQASPDTTIGSHQNLPGQTVYTNIQTSMSPEAYHVGEYEQQPNIYYAVQGPFNPSSNYIVYSYNEPNN